jgi:hypothetical protein
LSSCQLSQFVSTLAPHARRAAALSSLRRSLLRWHCANLEYGCAAPLGRVSLQSWDQDDVFK